VRILTRYLVARFLGLFATFLILSMGTIMVMEMMLNLGDMLKGDHGLPGAASYLILRIPSYYLGDLIPIVAFAAAFFTFGSASRWLEITAMKAGGLSPFRIATPILLTGGVLVAGTFLLNETLVLGTTRAWNLRESGGQSGVLVAFRQGSFWYRTGRTIYNIGLADRATMTLRGVRVYELDERYRLIRSIEANKAHLESENHWRFVSPLIRHFDPAASTEPPSTVRHQGAVTFDMGVSADVALMNADTTTLPLPKLWQVITNRKLGARQLSSNRALFHSRLAEPFAVWALVLAAIPLGMRIERSPGHGMTLSALYGVVAVAAFFSLRSLGTTLTAAGLLPPSPAPWLLLLAFVAFGSWQYRRMST
jgi:lipopolysaccharide export system permease protein